MSNYKFFISHASEDNELVNRFCDFLILGMPLEV